MGAEDQIRFSAPSPPVKGIHCRAHSGSTMAAVAGDTVPKICFAMGFRRENSATQHHSWKRKIGEKTFTPAVAHAILVGMCRGYALEPRWRGAPLGRPDYGEVGNYMKMGPFSIDEPQEKIRCLVRGEAGPQEYWAGNQGWLAASPLRAGYLRLSQALVSTLMSARVFFFGQGLDDPGDKADGVVTIRQFAELTLPQCTAGSTRTRTRHTWSQNIYYKFF